MQAWCSVSFMKFFMIFIYWLPLEMIIYVETQKWDCVFV